MWYVKGGLLLLDGGWHGKTGVWFVVCGVAGYGMWYMNMWLVCKGWHAIAWHEKTGSSGRSCQAVASLISICGICIPHMMCHTTLYVV